MKYRCRSGTENTSDGVDVDFNTRFPKKKD